MQEKYLLQLPIPIKMRYQSLVKLNTVPGRQLKDHHIPMPHRSNDSVQTGAQHICRVRMHRIFIDSQFIEMQVSFGYIRHHLLCFSCSTANPIEICDMNPQDSTSIHFFPMAVSR